MSLIKCKTHCTPLTSQLRTRPCTTEFDQKSKIPILQFKPDVHALGKADETCKKIRKKSNPRPDWIKLHLIMKKNGMISAANAISDSICGQCNKQNCEERRINRSYAHLETIDGCAYNGKAMDTFSDIVKHKMEEQFGRWPRVYEKMPELRMTIFRGSIEEIDEC